LKDRDIERTADPSAESCGERHTGQKKADTAVKGRISEKPFWFLSKFADGIPGAAIHFSESELFSQQREEVLDMMTKLPSAARADLLVDYFSYFDANKAQADDILGIMSTWIRDMLIFSMCNDKQELINEDKRNEIVRYTPKGTNAVNALTNADRIIHSARRGIALNSSFENCICTMLLQLRKEFINA
jgi:hypothetical protein